MPVYNAAEYLLEACNSILQQSFDDFELLVIEDGSSDKSYELLRSIDDTRMQLHRNPENEGLISSLNKGIDLARGELIARMDADDICLPDRFRHQVAFMDKNKDIVISGGLFQDLADAKKPVIRQAGDPEEIKCRLFFYTALAHPTVIYRTKEMRYHALYYNSNYKHAEDFELWVRASRKVKISNINKVLIRYRRHSAQVSREHDKTQVQNLNKCRLEQLEEFAIDFNERDAELHLRIANQDYSPQKEFIADAEHWLIKLNEHNESSGFFSPSKFSRLLGEYWIAICRKGGKEAETIFNASQMNSLKFLTFAQKLKYNF